MSRIVISVPHGFSNPAGLRVRVAKGRGTGEDFNTLRKPVPLTRV